MLLGRIKARTLVTTITHTLFKKYTSKYFIFSHQSGEDLLQF